MPNANARLSKRFIIRAGHISAYMFGNIEYKITMATQLTSVKGGIIPFSLYLLSSKSHSQLDEPVEHQLEREF
jgi:hypothetical protein